MITTSGTNSTATIFAPKLRSFPGTNLKTGRAPQLWWCHAQTRNTPSRVLIDKPCSADAHKSDLIIIRTKNGPEKIKESMIHHAEEEKVPGKTVGKAADLSMKAATPKIKNILLKNVPLPPAELNYRKTTTTYVSTEGEDVRFIKIHVKFKQPRVVS